MILQYLPIIIPSFLGYSKSIFCKVQNTSGIIVNFRPPPVVFSIVWPILYIMLGFSWYYARKLDFLADIFYTLLNILLCLWIFVYSCKSNKKLGIYILVLSFMLSLMCYTIGNNLSKLLLVPLISWLIFATLLNIFEVQELKN